jgi:hypothetical protein
MKLLIMQSSSLRSWKDTRHSLINVASIGSFMETEVIKMVIHVSLLVFIINLMLISQAIGRFCCFHSTF